MSLARLPLSFGRIRQAALKECHNVTLGELMRQTSTDPESLQRHAQWLKEQLPIRFARRIEDILQLPHFVVSNPQMSSILDSYVSSFESIYDSLDITNSERELLFLNTIRTELVKHHPGTRLIAEGYREVRRTYPALQLDAFLHDHFTMRIATRILMDNYVIMREPRPGFVGVVCQGMQPVDIVRESVEEVSRLCRDIHGCAPQVEYRGNLDCVLDYIPRHVKYMVRELLKNAFRSTMERRLTCEHGLDTAESPNIAVEFQQGDLHVIIKISDLGGGMPKHAQKEAWRFGWTTVESSQASGGGEKAMYVEESCSWDRSHDVQDPGSQSKRGELAGYGFGLPLTRLHAQYFGGDVFLQALPGLGTDAYLLLTHLKEGTPSTEVDDLATVMQMQENQQKSMPPHRASLRSW